MRLAYEQFSKIDLSDPFFDSLKSDYKEFSTWFDRKSEEFAYVFRRDSGNIDGFLYLKEENGSLDDVVPTLPPLKRLKVGTLKINPHGTKLGERFLKKIFDHAIAKNVDEIYVTVFEKHSALVKLLERYGFKQRATKTTVNGVEQVLIKQMLFEDDSALARYPLIKLTDNKPFLLSLYPKWHTRLLPDSILKTEDASIVQDVSHTNSIHKVYLAAMDGMEKLQAGDVLLIYRTSDGIGSAHYRSVITSICVVEEYTNIRTFKSQDDFIRYCEPYSVFNNQELIEFWQNKKYPHVIRFTYNFALPKRITRGRLIEEMGFDATAYWGFMPLTKEQLRTVIAVGNLNENFVIN